MSGEKEMEKTIPTTNVEELAHRANVRKWVARAELRKFFSGHVDEVDSEVRKHLPDSPPTPKEFTFRYDDRDGNPKSCLVVENDIPLHAEEAKKYHEQKKKTDSVSRDAAEHGLSVVGPSPAGLLGQTVNGKLDRLAPTVAHNITWWLLEETFKDSGLDVEDVSNNLIYAMTDWEKVCGVKFKKATSKESAYMVVRYTDTSGDPQMSGVIAMAFFPSQPRSERIVHIFTGYATASDSVVGILRHELGHVLGFRHEHARLGSLLPERFREDLSNTVPLTKYDPKSVMHYNFSALGLGGTSALEISELDSYGAKYYYGGPLNAFTDVDH